MSLTSEAILSHLFTARPRLCAAAYAITRDTLAAEDIFQNVALKAVTKDVTFEHEGALLSWATISTKREGIDWIRKRRPETVGLEEEVIDLLQREWEEDEGYVNRSEGARMEALKDCLEKLPAKTRRLLELRYFEGYSCGEVADRVGVGVGAVYQRLSRLHRQLKKCIDSKLELESAG